MRTTIDIPESLLEEAMKISHARTKTTTIILALKELINIQKREELAGLMGKIQLTTDTKVTRKR